MRTPRRHCRRTRPASAVNLAFLEGEADLGIAENGGAGKRLVNRQSGSGMIAVENLNAPSD